MSVRIDAYAYLVGIALCLWIPGYANAQCSDCADLEERIAELEATVARCIDVTKGTPCFVGPDTASDVERLNKAFANLDTLFDTDKTTEASAVAASLADPDLTDGEKFGIRMNWGGIEGENALGFSGTAVLGQWDRSRFAVSGAVGFGLEHDQVGGRVGGQFTWK